MNHNLLILGAGVDRTTGIDFPLANTLLADVTRYLDGPGKEVDEALRAMLPGLRFSFNTVIARAVDKIATREPHEQKAMVKRVQEAIAHLPPDQEAVRKHGELIIRLFNKLATIAEHSQLDLETEELIREVFPKDANELIDSDSILDIHKLSLSDTFKTVLKRTLKQGHGNGRIGRLWQTLILTRWNPLFADMPVESLVHEHQAEYYPALQNSTDQVDSSPFIEFMLRMILDAVSSVAPQVEQLLATLFGEMTREELQNALGLQDRKSFRERYLKPALTESLIEMTLPDKPNSRLQQYRLTDKGRRWLHNRNKVCPFHGRSNLQHN